jgi:hypothetical protein
VALGNHTNTQGIGAAVWDASSGKVVKEFRMDSSCVPGFSPAGKWLVTAGGDCRLWEVGTWVEGPLIDSEGGMVAFSRDDRVVAVGNETGVIRLVEAATGREYVRLDAPVQTRFKPVAFTADGSQLLALGLDSQALHVLDLRRIRRELANLGLDWDAPMLPDPPEKAPPAIPAVKVDLGAMTPNAMPVGGPPEMCIQRCGAILKADPDDVQAYLERSYARTRLGQLAEAAADLERVLAVNKDQIWACNALAWLYATGPEAIRDPGKALPLAERAAKLAPGMARHHCTLGVAYYRNGRYRDAIPELETSLKRGQGQFDHLNLYFLAMCHYQLGEAAKAREYFDRATRWEEGRKLSADQREELQTFRSEARKVLGAPP